jgi:hypothetical protein
VPVRTHGGANEFEIRCRAVVRWALIAAAPAAITVAVLASTPISNAAGPDPAGWLSCAGDRMAVTHLTHDAETVATETPEEIGARYASSPEPGRLRASPLIQTLAYRSADRVDLAFSEGSGPPRAVLSFERHPKLGWRLELIHECA